MQFARMIYRRGQGVAGAALAANSCASLRVEQKGSD